MTTAIAARPVDTLKVQLAAPKMQAWLGKQIHASLNRNASQMINIVLQAATQNESLAKCTPGSILANLCLAGQIGLVPNTALGHAWLVPFLNSKPPAQRGGPWLKVMEAQLVIGYKGYVKLVHDAAGLVVQAQPVYAGDEFDYDLASFPPVKYHRPGKGDRGPLVAAWCHLKTRDGQVFGEVMTQEDIYKRRAVSKSYLDRDGKPRKDSPWVLHEPEMWRKTAVRHALKLAPAGNDERLERALSADDEQRDNPADVIDMSEAPDELRDFDRAAIEGQQALPPPNPEELSSWLQEFAVCSDLRSLDDVAAKAKRGAAPACQPELERAYIQHCDRIRGQR